MNMSGRRRRADDRTAFDWEAWRFRYLRRVVGTALGALGLQRSTALATALGRGVYDLSPPGRRVAEERLARAFGGALAAAERDAIVRTMYEHIGRFWIEALFLRRLLRRGSWEPRVSMDSSGPELDAAAHAGCVLATCYFGNPAVAAFALGQRFRPVCVVVDWLFDPHARAWQEHLYHLDQVRTIAAAEVAAQAPRVLSTGGAAMLVVEHRRHRGRGTEASFLGQRGVYRATAGQLAAWCQVPVLPVLCRRKAAPMQFELWCGRAVRGSDAQAITADVLQQLETQVHRWPEQYLWSVPMPTEDADPQPAAAGIIETASERPEAPTAR